MSRVLVIAPHGDDETLGCGGTLLRHKAGGDQIHWLLVTTMTTAGGYAPEPVAARSGELEAVRAAYGFDGFLNLGHRPASLDRMALAELIGEIASHTSELEPEIVYLPSPSDAHSDHGIVFKAAVAALKPFRARAVRSLRVYETPSETDFGIDPVEAPFRPNLFIDITAHLEAKIEIMKLYKSEIKAPPFPRSEMVIRAQATVRGAVAGSAAAEAFMSLRDIQR